MAQPEKMGETDKIRAMEEGQSLDTARNTSTEQKGEEEAPESPSVRSWFSFGSRAPLVPNTSGDGRFLALLKGKRGPRAPNKRLETVVRPVHGGINGYPKLAAFLDSDDNFMVYRRFGYIQSRILLARQEKLRRLEAQLEELDEEQVADSNEPKLLCKAKIGGEMQVERESLMLEIEAEYLQYTQILQAAQTMVTLSKPSFSEWDSVSNFIVNHKPLVKDQAGFILRKEDLITLRPGREYAWLDSFIERLLRWCHSPLLDSVFRSEETKRKSDDDSEVYYTRTRIDKAVNAIIMLMILVLLISPIWPLYRLTEGTPTVHTSAICIGVLLVFTLAFSAVITLFTRGTPENLVGFYADGISGARRHEILATSAAYCAVLVVFISNVGGQRSNGIGAGN